MSPLDIRFTATLQKSPNKGGWTYVIWPKSAEFFGTKGLVKVAGAVEGQEFQSSFMPMGDGNHLLPVKAAILKTIRKVPGDMVEIYLTKCLSCK